MPEVETTTAPSEDEFALLVDELSADVNQRQQLLDLLREEHSFYSQRGAATVVEMRGWVLLALGRAGVADDSLLFVLEELDTGVDAYLVAAAACALRTYPTPNPTLAPFVMRALEQIRYHDDPVSFQAYGDFSSPTTSPLRELLLTLAWLGQHARGVLPELETYLQAGGLSKKALLQANQTLETIRGTSQVEQPDSENCCALPGGLGKYFWSTGSRRNFQATAEIVFEDQDGEPVTFKEFFLGQPSIVVFFYTRCGNPLKCSLTVAKLARMQKLLESEGLSEQIHTAAITYDPEFDLHDRMRRYGESRGVRTSPSHRLLRAPGNMKTLSRHFKLGVNFIETLVNRHRLEVYVLDPEGKVAASFERLHWDEQEVVDRAIEVLSEDRAMDHRLDLKNSNHDGVSISKSSSTMKRAFPILGSLASLGVAFFPKCPICWAALFSMFGIAGLNQIPYSPWLRPILILAMLVNIGSVALRGWITGRFTATLLVITGATGIIISMQSSAWERVAVIGVALTLVGSLLSAVGAIKDRRSRSLKTATDKR